MKTLTDEQKQTVIDLALIRYSSESHSFFSTKKEPIESFDLRKILESNEIELERKWQQIKTYLYQNTNQLLNNILTTVIRDAKKMDKKGESSQITDKYTEEDLSYCKKDFKIDVINKLITVQDLNFGSFELLQILKNNPNNVKTQWKAIIKFAKFNSNRRSPLFAALFEILENHDINSDYTDHARKNIQTAKTKKAAAADKKEIEKYYLNAISALKRVSPRTHTALGLLGKCYLNIDKHRKAYFYYNEAAISIQKIEGYDPIKHLKYEMGINESIDNTLKLGDFNSINLDNRHEKDIYKQHYLHSSTTPGFRTGLTGGLYSAQYSIFLLGLPKVSLIILAASLVIFLGSTAAGAAHGAACIHNRHPLDVREQDILIKNLETLARQKDNDPIKQKIIDEAVKKYTKTQYLSSSNSSVLLMLRLEATGNPLEIKWRCLQGYLLERVKNHFMNTVIFRNNGKKLYLIIANEISKAVQEIQETGKNNLENNQHSAPIPS